MNEPMIEQLGGPFIVTDVSTIDNNTVTIDALDTPGRPQLVDISRLKPFIPCPARDTFMAEAGGSQCQQINAAQQH
uniref:Uncharacterized protein n=1 Tax=Romanomermis culicivorax TaxID=13658 RepID=A0A915I3S6_ROMCU